MTLVRIGRTRLPTTRPRLRSRSRIGGLSTPPIPVVTVLLRRDHPDAGRALADHVTSNASAPPSGVRQAALTGDEGARRSEPTSASLRRRYPPRLTEPRTWPVGESPSHECSARDDTYVGPASRPWLAGTRALLTIARRSRRPGQLTRPPGPVHAATRISLALMRRRVQNRRSRRRASTS